MKNILNIFLLVFIYQAVSAQVVPFDLDHWEVQSQSYILEQYKGYNSVYLKSGRIILKDDQFKNGIIEFDILMTERRAFPGLFFRITDDSNYEEFYFRPHLSGKPDANQYTPVFNGNAAWQLYFGPSFSAPTVYPFDEWMHVKVLVLNDKAEFYFNQETEPSLAVDLKMTPQAGKIGLKSALNPMHFANFQYQKTDNVPLKGKEPVKEAPMENIISTWQVSDVFEEKSLTGTSLSTANKKRNWQTMSSEVTGTVNISRIRKYDQQKNTVFARLVINSNSKQTKAIKLGYSDRTKVYLNGQLLYAGDNGFRTRDYRYLGTIGYFDTIYLPLKKGDNELWVAVSENFGGWAVRGIMDERNGIKIKRIDN